MTDRAYEPADANPFHQFNNDGGDTETAPTQQQNPFHQFNSDQDASQSAETSTTGALRRGAERSIVPAIGSWPAIGAGAEFGAEAGTMVAGPPGALIGGALGAAAGGLGTSYALSKAQNWALSQLPDSWKDKLGLSDRQQQIDEGEHPIASFIGGLVPYLVTMRPGAVSKVPLPENATALQHILAHPAAARLFGGAAIGGMELGQEKVEDPNISWSKVAIATAFGMVFNRPTRIGEKITELGAQPARALLGRPSPTLAQAADAKVMGPGVTEDVFQGSQAQDPVAEATAQEGARQEAATLEPPAQADLHAAARAANPELFAHYDDLLARQRVLSDWFGEGSPIAGEHLQATQSQIAQVAPEVAAAYRRAAEGANAVTVPAERFPTMADMLAAREAQGTPRAATAPGTEAEPRTERTVDEQNLPRTIEQQRDFIRTDVSRQLIAAGRPQAEAEAAGAVVAARYEARAGRFNGALGTPQELYEREGAEIRGAKPPAAGGAPPVAQPKPEPPGPPTAAELAEPAQAQAEPAVTAPRRAAGPASRDPNTFSLLEFLARNGGIRSDDPLAADLRQSFGGKNKFVPGFGQLIRSPRDVSTAAARSGQRGPMSLDTAREAAVEAGYISDAGEISRGVTQSSIEDLLQAVDREARGEKVYRQGYQPKQREAEPGEEEHHRAAFIRDLDEYAQDKYALTDAERARALQLYEKENVHEVAEVLERLYLEADNREIEQGSAGPRDEPIPGWDEVPALGAAIARPGEAVAAGEPKQPGSGIGGAGGERARGTASWVIREKGTKNVIMETFDRKKVDALNTDKYEAIPIQDYLAELNRNIKETAPEVEYFQTREREQSKEYRDALAAHNVAFKEFQQAQSDYRSRKIKDFDQATAEFIAARTKFDEATKVFDAAYEQEQTAARKSPRKKGQPDLIAEREAEGQLGLPGAERISDAELAQRKANAPLKPTAEQKPMDEGLFGTAKDQKELFQSQLGKIRLGGQRPIITLARTADASTFIHETGHAWLEELMRDADHPQAPGDVKADASTVLDWLGAEKAESVTTRQHEKFARGFEQYMREGVAPSSELAGVFAKFRDWLLRIYQSLKGLGTEITPQIREVFDRMLSTAPQRTVIAPERMERPTLADIHSADAEETHATEAAPMLDRVLAETNQFVQDLPPELQHELATARAATAVEPGAEGATGAERIGGVGEGGGATGPEPAGGVGRATDGQELPGGGGAGAESPAKPASGERPGQPSATDANLGDKPLAPRPKESVGEEESKFLDKAGNIRLENLTNDNDVRQAIRDAADENEDFIGDRRGVVTDGQVMDLAADLGMEGAEKLVRERVTGQAYNAEQVMALRKLLIQSATDVSALMKRAAEGTDADLMEYARAKARHQMIQGTVAQATAEAGRALRAFRDIAGTPGQADLNEFLQQATGKTLFQLRQEAKLGATLNTPQQVSKFINNAQDRNFGRMILEYWINGLISGPATHVTYMVGNTLLALEKAGPETAAAAMIGRARAAMGRTGETVRMGEVAEQIKAGARAMSPAIKAALDAFRSGVTTMLPGEEAAQNILRFPGQEFATAPMLDEAAKLSDVLESGYSIVRGMRDGLIAGGGLAEAGEPAPRLLYSTTGVIPDIRIGGAVLPLGTIIRGPSRFIAAIHSFFRAVNYSMEKNRLAYRTAMNEGLNGEALDSRIGDLRQNPSDAMMQQARGEATELTLMGQGGAITQALARLTNTPIFGFPLLKFIDPFVHISSNIINQSIIERTPLGVLSPEIRADLMGKNGNVAQDTAMARMLMGSIYAISIGGLAAEGYISGSEPTDPKQAAMWRLAGNQAHSVKVGDTWFDVHRLGPLGMLLGIAADLQSVAHAVSDGDLLLAGSHLQHAITQNILDESFMRGPADLIQAIEDPARYGEYYLRSQLSSFVPFSVGMAQMARASDPYSRQARTVMDQIKAKVPFESQALLPKRDIWGEEIPNKPALLAAGVTAIYEQRLSHDPVNLALYDLGIYPAQLERKIRNVQLTDQQYDDYQRIGGRMTKMRLNAIVNSPDFATWPNHVKAYIIRETIRNCRESARGMMMMKYPQIPRDAHDAKMKKLQD